MDADKRLTDEELATAKRNRAEGEASLACEGMHLTPEEKALFDEFERLRLPHDERRRRLLEFDRAQRRKKAVA